VRSLCEACNKKRAGNEYRYGSSGIRHGETSLQSSFWFGSGRIESSVRCVEVANHGSGCGCAATGHTVTAAENRYETAPAHERSSDLGTAYHIFKQGGVLASLRKQANKIGHPLHAPITSDSASMAAVLRLTSRWIRSSGSEALGPKHSVESLGHALFRRSCSRTSIVPILAYTAVKANGLTGNAGFVSLQLWT
jgi:hypothetical protein